MEYLISTCYDLIFVVPKVAGEGWLSGGKWFEGGGLHQAVYPNVDYQYQGECSLSNFPILFQLSNNLFQEQIFTCIFIVVCVGSSFTFL